jgi:hypothetical protein
MTSLEQIEQSNVIIKKAPKQTNLEQTTSIMLKKSIKSALFAPIHF